MTQTRGTYRLSSYAQGEVEVVEKRAAPNYVPLHARVLLAEDNLVNQTLCVKLLEKWACKIDCVTDGAAALRAIERQPYDLVLMDCQMPEMDGYEAARALRLSEAGTGNHLPIIALTANALEEDRMRCLNAGMDDYVAKPFRASELYRCLARWLDERRRAA